MDSSVDSGFYSCHLRLPDVYRCLFPFMSALRARDRKTTSWSSTRAVEQLPLCCHHPLRVGQDMLNHSIWTFFLPSKVWPSAHTHLPTPYLLHSFLAPTVSPGSCHMPSGPHHHIYAAATGWSGDLSWVGSSPPSPTPLTASTGRLLNVNEHSCDSPDCELHLRQDFKENKSSHVLVHVQPSSYFSKPSFSLLPIGIRGKGIPLGCSFLLQILYNLDLKGTHLVCSQDVRWPPFFNWVTGVSLSWQRSWRTGREVISISAPQIIPHTEISLKELLLSLKKFLCLPSL